MRVLPAAFDLTGCTAVVTGAGSPTGIGFATARLLAEGGASVVVAATSRRVHQRAATLRDRGLAAHACVGDLTRPEDCAALVDFALGPAGRLDVLVNNAGMVSVSDVDSHSGDIEGTDPRRWRASLERNLDTAYLMCRAALPALRDSELGGRIINVASVTGPVMAMRGEVAYAAAKAGLVGLTRALAVDEGPRGVTVNAVAPGWIETGSQTPDEAIQGRSVPLGISGRPEEVASAIAWLAGPYAAYTTGQLVVIDGGNSVAEERGR